MRDPLETQHRYIANGPEDITEMLGVIGVESVDRLYDRFDRIFAFLAEQQTEGTTLSAFAESFRRQLTPPANGAIAELSATELTWTPRAG